MERRASRLSGEYRRLWLDLTTNTIKHLLVRLALSRKEWKGLEGCKSGSLHELGQDLHELLENLADDKLRARGLAKGRYESGREASSCMVAAKAVSFCLLGKVSKLGQPSAELGPSMGEERREALPFLGRKIINP